MFLSVYLHNLNPVAVPLWGGLAVAWYGLSYIAGFLAAYWVMRGLARRGKILLKPEIIGDFIVALALGTMLGGRLGYCLLYQPDLFADFRPTLPFWGVLAIHEGGMASHGGIVGLLLACLYFSRQHKITPYHLFDLVALTGTIGVFFGRIANFVNGELFGRPCSETLPWAVRFPQEMHDWDKAKLAKLAGALDGLGLRADSPRELIKRVIGLIQQGHAEVSGAVAPLLEARHPSQLYEALLEGVFLFVALWWIWRLPRRPGVVAGWFLVLYPIVRIAGEQFRTPDAHLGFQALGLTRGQWISFVMLALGTACLVWWSRRPVDRLGGWGRSRLSNIKS